MYTFICVGMVLWLSATGGDNAMLRFSRFAQVQLVQMMVCLNDPTSSGILNNRVSATTKNRC